MSVVHLQAVEILNATAAFADPYIFKITFECISELSEDIEWKLIYVGSAEDEKYDQELDNCLVGPVPVGVNSFEFEAAAPSPDKIPVEDLLGVTVILLTGSYRDQEFIRVGYYVNNEYETQELKENPPEKVDLTKVKREVLVSKPRVTRFNIKWDTATAAAAAATASSAATSSSAAMSAMPGESSTDVALTAGETSLAVPPQGGDSAVVVVDDDDDDDDDGANTSGVAQASSFKPVSAS
ncbi:unnamed protein product [Parajaminaea phylloscopi]